MAKIWSLILAPWPKRLDFKDLAGYSSMLQNVAETEFAVENNPKKALRTFVRGFTGAPFGD